MQPGSQKGKVIGVFTSGGDSQGMNSAVRAVVRVGVFMGVRVFFIREGYQGMVDGGEYIVEAKWPSVSGIIQYGGTVIGSARCMDFRERPGRLRAAKNLIQHGIDNLVVIGGDGSLTGADTFRREWPELIAELQNKGEITEEQYKRCAQLNIIGMVGSIDNDFCGTDMTIGTDSALHRIMEAIDSIVTTASSHQRTYIMEVMGRHCGYLALVAALASEADYVFIPERPPEGDWAADLCKKLQQEREAGKKLSLVIASEGAIDDQGKAISVDAIKKAITDNLKYDTRIIVLGHIQRGGAPSAFDRILGCRMGTEATLSLLNNTSSSAEASVVSLDSNQVVRLPLMDCVEKTKAVAKFMANKDWENAVKARGKSFENNLQAYKLLSRVSVEGSSGHKVLAVIHIGAPCCGINAAVRSFVRNGIVRGFTMMGVSDGIDGLLDGNVKELRWNDVTGWNHLGGAYLGTRRTTASGNIPTIAQQLAKFNINGLLIIGGFEAYQTALQLYDGREAHSEFRIPICVIPATISNNVPGTEFSLGADTAVNTITNILDKIRQSAQGTKRRVFIVEVMGGNCGYLTTVAGLASGADAAYIWEDPFTTVDVLSDIGHLKAKMHEGISRGLVLRNEKANENFTTDFLEKLYAEEGRDHFSVRMNVLGHMQQGGSPSPYDRNLGTKLGAKAATWFSDMFDKGESSFTQPESACLLGLIKRGHVLTPVKELKMHTDFVHRMPLPQKQWWLILRGLNRILGRFSCTTNKDHHQQASSE